MKGIILIVLLLSFVLFISFIYSQTIIQNSRVENKSDNEIKRKPHITITVKHNPISINKHYPYYKYISNKEVYIKNPLIWSFAYSYNWEKMKLFIISLRKWNYDGDLVIGISDYLYDELKDKIIKYNIKAIIIEDEWPFYSIKNNPYFPINETFIKEKMIEERYYSMNDKWNVYRYSILNMWLLIYGNKYSHIMNLDIRDIIFQDNPFKWNFEDGMYLVDETKYNITLGEEKYNLKWIEVYDGYEKILNERILNSGTIFGSTYYFVKFVNQFTEFMRNNKKVTNEQGTMNYLYHTNYFKEIKFLMNKNEYGIVYTMALDHIYFHEICKFNIKDKILYNADFSKPLIIHQYDRHKHFVELFMEVFADD